MWITYLRLVHTQLSKYLSVNNLLHESQSGFRKGYSTQSSLLCLTDHVYNELNQGKLVGMVALDLKKAFDTVNHKIVIDKLAHYGITSVENKWFKNYLSNRQQCSDINGIKSDPLLIMTGVPQGSILGPLLFIIYVNDLPSCFELSNVNMYADDTTFYFSSFEFDIIKCTLQKDLNNIYDWLKANKLSLNVAKTNSILVCNNVKRSKLPVDELSLSLNNDTLDQVKSTNYLGVILDEEFTFKAHIEKHISKLKQSTGVLRRVSPFIPLSIRKILYNTLFMSHLDYCSPVWCTLPKTIIQRLQRIQNRCMRIILDSHPHSHAKDLLEELKFMSVHQRFTFNNCVQMWKIIHNHSPSYLANMFTLKSHTCVQTTRSSLKLDVFIHRSHPLSFQFVGSRAWNSLPHCIQAINTSESFKTNCALFIIKNYPQFI